MKRLLPLLVLTFWAHYGVAQDKPAIKWYSFEEATALNQEDPKMVLVDVYTDWCGWCKKMDRETFTDDQVIHYLNENFYAVKLDAENNGEKFEFKGQEYTEASMARAMRVSSYPNFVIIDATMENITQLPGYRKPDAFIKDLKETIERFGKE
ncbi:thioredoxin family protein [Echinicola vietnamensis]|uniref:Thioredoxin-related protein n=1 Tax=Echinicola vietnamensis (strain DSM 17526 / LMG 23754 / KMM 6221) TaxID=926556 RepID=L0G0K3_ECHVK|nr:thioredoxin fold domain-containing protein [Echinicola vietnamensis]AGA79724.1 thioredoxin-related protein [Echinicola vietnamensis DSM 17526]